MHEIILLVAGLVVGSMNAIAGGGMLVGFPVMLAVGMTPLSANVTSNLVVMPGNLTAVYGYRKYIKRVDRKYLYLLIPNIGGAFIGAMLLSHTTSDNFENLIPILIGFAVALFAFQPYIHFHLNRHLRGLTKGVMPLVFLGLAIVPLAIYGGYFGAGYGFIMLAFLGFTKMHEVHQMNGLKNLSAFCISVVALAVLIPTGQVNWRYGLIMAFGCALGSYFGTVITQKVSNHSLRIVIIAIGIITASYLAVRAYQV